jgi:hypothetical protein
MKITSLCRSASDTQRSLGVDWYPCARRVVGLLAERHGRQPCEVAAVMAITSPATTLHANVNHTMAALGGDYRVGRYPNVMGPKVREVLERRAPPDKVVSGPKVAAFFRAIMGDTDAVVLDRWAIRCALGPDAPPWGVTRMRKAEQRFRQAAAELGLTPRETQAVAWKVMRDTHRRGSMDIHEIEQRILGS